jgi:hypothetical protein
VEVFRRRLIQRHTEIALGCSRSCDRALAIKLAQLMLGALAGQDGGAQFA